MFLEVEMNIYTILLCYFQDCLAIELSNFVAKETDHSTRLLEVSLSGKL